MVQQTIFAYLNLSLPSQGNYSNAHANERSIDTSIISDSFVLNKFFNLLHRGNIQWSFILAAII